VAADGKPKQTAIRHNDRNTMTHPFMEPTNTNTPQGHLVPAMGTCRRAGEPIIDQSMARQLGLAASENNKHLRQRTATIRREQTEKNATDDFEKSNYLNVLGFKQLVDIEGVTGSIPVAQSSGIELRG
jgi:hypothetical protein